MKSRIILGLIALQLAPAATVSAQNYYIKIGGDKATRIADHASWEQGPVNFDESLESYNLNLPSGDKAVGLIRFHSPSGTMSYATHYRYSYPPEQVTSNRILTPAYNNDLYVIGEKTAPGSGVKSVVVLHYDKTNGKLIEAHELPYLPSGFEFVHVYDVISEPTFNNNMRILCITQKSGVQAAMELLYNASSNQYKILQYKPANLEPEKYNSIYYVRAYHYGEFNLGEISFYGMGTYKDKSIAYCYYNGKYEQYHLYSDKKIEKVAGVQMNGSYGVNGNHFRIDMAFIDAEGAICIQQKDELTTLNWRRFYLLPDGKFRMGWGKDGHGTKQGGGKDYFIAAALTPNSSDPDGQVTTLHYDAFNGDMDKPNLYNFSGIGVNKGGGFPNSTYDPTYNYTFIADRFKQEHGFKFGTGNASTTSGMPCVKQYDVKELRNTLKEYPDDVSIHSYDIYNAEKLGMEEVSDITVDVLEECFTEQRADAPGSGYLLPSDSKLGMNSGSLHLEASKTIVALSLFSIDGRLVSQSEQINNNSFEKQFATPLTPGIYLVRISYADHSSEVRKVSVQ